MKNIIKISLIGFLILIGSQGCEEQDFLKEKPKDNIYAENLLQNYDGFENMMNAIYAWVRTERRRFDPSGGIPLTRYTVWGCGVDNAFMNNGHSKMAWMNWPTTANPEQDVWSSMWEWLYKIVNSSNMVISRANDPGIDWQGTTPAQNEENKNFIIAQARVIRAWAYRHLTYSWGDVPLSLDEITGANYRNDWKRTPINEVRAQMVEDLTFGVDNLKMRYNNPGVVNKAVALYYLAETYINLKDYGKAVEAAKTLCESGEYQLMTERFGAYASDPGNAFMDVFKNPLPSEGNMESLWVLLNTEPENVAYGYEDGMYPNNMWMTYYSKDENVKQLNLDIFYTYNGGRGAGRCSITAPALSWYESQDDRYSEYAIKKFCVYPNDAGGLDTVLWTNTDHVITEGKYDLDHYQWPSTRKWEYVNPVPEKAQERDQYNNLIYLRLSDAYLLYAEALLDNGQPGQAAIWINKVRERSNATNITAGDVDIDFILDERSRELVTEEPRRETLIRTGKFKERVKLYNDFASPTIDDAPVLFPIPQSVIDANTGSVLKQNPGYN